MHNTAEGVGHVVSEQLARIEAYLDTVPRALVKVEEMGPFTVFHRSSGWPYYARPRLDGAGRFTTADVERVRARQQKLGVPESFEWVEEISPQLAEVITAAGLEVKRHQLMVLDQLQPPPAAEGFRVRILDADDRPGLAAARAAVKLGFAHTGMERGPVGIAERDTEMAAGDQAAQFVGDCIHRGLVVSAAAEYDAGPVAGGSYAPRDGVAEITGVATLPAFRGRGIARSLTSALVEHARAHGTGLCFLWAENDAVAQLYQKLGFVKVGTADTAEPASSA